MGNNWIDEGEVKEGRVERRTYKRFSLNRHACDVLQVLRTMHETHNYSGLMAAVEELQAMFNSMESALRYRSDIQEWHREAREIADTVDKMQEEAHKMGVELDSQKYNSLAQNVKDKESYGRDD
jgi:hypothetical protein